MEIAVNSLHEAIEGLDKEINVLAVRLAPVLGSDAPSAIEKNVAEKLDTAAPLLITIGEAANRIQRVKQHVRTLIVRLVTLLDRESGDAKQAYCYLATQVQFWSTDAKAGQTFIVETGNWKLTKGDKP